MSYDISSRANERIKRLVRLRDRRHRDAEGVFVVEGLRLIERAVAAGLEPLELYTDGSVAVASSTTDTVVEPAVLDRASYRDRSQGVIGVFSQFPTHLDLIEPSSTPLVVAAEAMEKPGNLGAILRVADAVGADAVVTLGEGVDCFNPNVVRTSTGAIFSVPYAHTSLNDLVAWCRSHEIAMTVATPESDTSLYDVNLSGPVCLLVGAEDKGVSAEAKEAADVEFSIPMKGLSDSLNVSTAAAICLYEALRQRTDH